MKNYTYKESWDMHYALIASNEALRAAELFMIGHGIDVTDINRAVMENDALLDELGEIDEQRTED